MNEPTTSANTASGARLWTARILSAFPILVLALSASLKLLHNPGFQQKWETVMGYPESLLTPIGLLEITCMLVYAVPRTRILGAILVTAYLGGATATHVRIADPPIVPIVLGIAAWLGLYLSDERIRALVPLRSPR